MSLRHATQNQVALHPKGLEGEEQICTLENDGDCRISTGSIPTVQMALLCGRLVVFSPPPSSPAFIERSGISLANDKRRQTAGKQLNGNVPWH